MESDNPLNPIWKVYEVAKDCFKVTQRSIKKEDDFLLRRTEFIGASAQTCTKWISKSRGEFDDFITLYLWVVFERFITSYLQEKGEKILEARPAWLSQKLYNKFEKEVEYWRIEDVLNLFKQNIDSRLIGDAKNIKKHRDWIAHRNPNRRSPGKVTPIFAYRILSNILAQIPE